MGRLRLLARFDRRPVDNRPTGQRASVPPPCGLEHVPDSVERVRKRLQLAMTRRARCVPQAKLISAHVGYDANTTWVMVSSQAVLAFLA